MKINELLNNNLGNVDSTPELIKQMCKIKRLAIQLHMEKLKLKAELLESCAKELEKWAKDNDVENEIAEAKEKVK